MAKLKIVGGKPLRGSLAVGGDEQTVLACQAASLLATRGTVILDHVSSTPAIMATNQCLMQLGAKVIFEPATATLKMDAGWHLTPLPLQVNNFFLAGAILARCRTVTLVNSPHEAQLGEAGTQLCENLAALGAQVQVEGDQTILRADYLTGHTFTVTDWSWQVIVATLMVATLTRGITVFKAVPQLPVINEVVALLNKMGAKIHQTQAQTLRVQGVNTLHGADWYVIDDQKRAGLYLLAAAVTAGDVVVLGAHAVYLRPLLHYLEACGNTVVIQHNGIRLIGTQVLLPTEEPPALRAMSRSTTWQAALLALHARQLGTSLVTLPATVAEKAMAWLPLTTGQESQLYQVTGPVTQLPGQMAVAEPTEALVAFWLALAVKQNTWLAPAELLGEVDGALLDDLLALGAEVTLEFT